MKMIKTYKVSLGEAPITYLQTKESTSIQGQVHSHRCNRKGKKAIVYPNLRSAMRPVGHSTDIPVPQPPAEMPSDDTGNSEESESDDDSYEPQPESGKKPYLITQPELSDLVRYLPVTKQQSELLASRHQEWNLLKEDARITAFRKRSSDLQQYFSMENNLCQNSKKLIRVHSGVLKEKKRGRNFKLA
ncbi:hypothetical protein Hamer_G017971 [Homarus americanus]|uniref:Uncharacterized protein n=1 Tax=Homarus americanus TaxID=6706 RepID=A0A8J5TAK4_HOMAM|nr:hypothetical protein Hamer_G017971 [Homarus americanus]